jgi:hypothetical protein
MRQPVPKKVGLVTRKNLSLTLKSAKAWRVYQAGVIATPGRPKRLSIFFIRHLSLSIALGIEPRHLNPILFFLRPFLHLPLLGPFLGRARRDLM